MPSERLQRQIDRLLDDAETAVGAREWTTVVDLANRVLALDRENADARGFLVLAQAGSGDPAAPSPAHAGDSPPPRELPDSFVHGRYRVTGFLGEGGRKQVYLARDGRLNREVAFAVIKTEGLDATGRERVTREAQAMGQLSGDPHIVTIHDVGETDRQPYIVSEYMAGGDVEALLAGAEQHQLPLERVLAIADDVAQALAHAHAAGVVHRDLKPGNIWLAEDGTAKLGDFGLAFAAAETRMTTEGTMLGTVAYMPPEQALGNPATAQSDLYALGCVLYELVAGRPPFLGDDAVAVISQHLNTAPVAPSWNRPDCPPALEALILALLAKAPADRLASADAVRAELARIDVSTPTPATQHQNPLDRLARGVFVGRERELQRLRAAFDRSLGGHGELVMLVGEPGVGKTRTTYELETYAKMRGAQVHWGRIHEASGAPAYWPWIQIGRSWGMANDPASLGLSAGTSGELVRLFPELREIGGVAEAPPGPDPEAAQFRLFDAYATFMRSVSGQRPLVLVVDDLHWADKPSLLLLQHLARELAGMRVLLVGTFRDTDLVRTHPLSDTLASLNRDTGFERIALRGLTPDECAAYIRGTAGVEPSPAVLARIVEETEGNPFFLGEVVNLMAQEGTIDATSLSDIRIPDGVREALGRRLDRMSEETNDVLQVAAVVGREFPYETLAVVSEADDDRLLALVEEAISARVIEELDRPGRYRFTHHLMQETLLDELSTTRRIRLHGRIGEALEARYGDRAPERASQLAQHFVESATLTEAHAAKALRYSVLAARRAEAQSGWGDAVRHYEAALSLVTEGVVGEDEAALTHALGRCQSFAATARDAWRNLMRAIDLYRARSDARGVAEATLDAGAIPTSIERLAGLRESALAMLGDADPVLRARLLSETREHAGAAAAAEAAALAEQYDLADVRDQLRFRDAWAEYQTGGLPRAAAVFASLRDDANAVYDVRVRAAVSAATSTGMVGDLSGWWSSIDEIERFARQRNDRVMMEFVHFHRASVQLARADLQGLAATAERMLPNAFGTAIVAGKRAMLRDDVRLAADRLMAYNPRDAGINTFVASLLGCQVEAVHAAGDDRTPNVLQDWLSAHESARPQGDFSNWATGMANAAEALVAVGERSDIERIYRDLDVPAARTTFFVDGLDYARGVLARGLGDPEAARLHFDAGRVWAHDAGAVVAEGRNLLGLAELASERDDTTVAINMLDAALDLFREHQAPYFGRLALEHKLALQGLLDLDLATSIDAVAASIDTQRPDLTPQAAPDGTVTLLFSDIEDSTARTAELGDAKWMALLREHNAIVREQLAAHSGYEVKCMGDGFMLAFRSARDGLRCAIALQRAIAARNAAAAEPIRVRIGLHTGEAIREADDFFGTHVNLAARVGGAAQGDEILVSGLLKALTESAGEFAFDEGRELELKGIAGPQRVHVVDWRS